MLEPYFGWFDEVKAPIGKRRWTYSFEVRERLGDLPPNAHFKATTFTKLELERSQHVVL